MARYELADKVALVTGGARGIGFATARALIARGASVVVADLDQAAVERAAAQLHDSRALGIAADVTDRGAMQRAVAATVERFGGLDVVVANAGIASRVATFRAMPTETFERVIDVDLMGVCRTVEAALPEIVARRGHVVVDLLDLRLHQRRRRDPLRDEQGRRRAVRPCAARRARSSMARAPAWPTSASSTPRWCTARSTRTSSPTDARSLPGAAAQAPAAAVAGEAIVRGIERRQPRIIRPRRWTVMSVLRGILNPLSDARARARRERPGTRLREIDARAGEDQPTTA